MKNWLIIIITLNSLQAASVEHEVVYKGGYSQLGYVSDMTADSILFKSLYGMAEQSIALDSILYIHNNEGKLFFISDDLQKFISKSLGRGGVITTVNGDVIPFSFLYEELFMYNPKLIYFLPETLQKNRIMLTEIHKIKIDYSLSEYAARKGFYLGSGISLLLYLSKFRSLSQLLNFNKVFNEFNNVYPSSIVAYPLTTLGWIIYDFFKGDRELVLNPLVNSK